MAKDTDNTATPNKEKAKNQKKVKTNNCPKCTKSANRIESNKEGSIRCKICTFWWHPTCAGLEKAEHELFIKLCEAGHPDL